MLVLNIHSYIHRNSRRKLFELGGTSKFIRYKTIIINNKKKLKISICQNFKTAGIQVTPFLKMNSQSMD